MKRYSLSETIPYTVASMLELSQEDYWCIGNLEVYFYYSMVLLDCKLDITAKMKVILPDSC